MAEYIERDSAIEETRKPRLTDAELRRRLANIPAADVRPVVRGEWVPSSPCKHKPYRVRNTDRWTIYKCSLCGQSNGRRFNTKFCPNCGAEMGFVEAHNV